MSHPTHESKSTNSNSGTQFIDAPSKPNLSTRNIFRPPTSPLNKLPVELRDGIFPPFPGEEWKGKIPNLIKALRPEKALYRDALAQFARLQTYNIHRSNNRSFDDMKESAILSIRTIRVQIDNMILLALEWEDDYFEAMFSKAKNVCKVTLDCR